MRFSAWRLEALSGDERIHGRQAAGHRVPPADGLHRREAREGEQVCERIHSQVLVEQDVELERGDHLPRLLEGIGYHGDDLRAVADLPRDGIVYDRRHEQRVDLETLTR